MSHFWSQKRKIIFAKISFLQVISFALQAEPIFDRPKIGEKGAAHRRTIGKAEPRGIYEINSGGKAQGMIF